LTEREGREQRGADRPRASSEFPAWFQPIDDPNERPKLDPELARHLHETETGVMLDHPVYRVVPYDPRFTRLYNLQFHSKLDGIKNAVAQGDWEKVLWLYEKPWRIAKVLELSPLMGDREYWQAVRFGWEISENCWQYRDDLPSLFHPTRRRAGTRKHLMTPYERRVLSGLPGVVTIYRGCGPENVAGWSWTLSRRKAEWFARRFCTPELAAFCGLLVVGRCSKRHILAYFSGRREREIVIDPSEVTIDRRLCTSSPETVPGPPPTRQPDPTRTPALSIEAVCGGSEPIDSRREVEKERQL